MDLDMQALEHPWLLNSISNIPKAKMILFLKDMFQSLLVKIIWLMKLPVLVGMIN
jgi:hypothetical protein